MKSLIYLGIFAIALAVTIEFFTNSWGIFSTKSGILNKPSLDKQDLKTECLKLYDKIR